MTTDVWQRLQLTSKVDLEKVRYAVGQPSDRVVLFAFFASLFCFHYGAEVLALASGGLFGSHSRAASSAEIIGFAAIVVVLKNFGTDRILRQWDFVAIIAAAIILIHPWYATRTLALTALGLLFVARSDKRLSSLGQLCIGLAWIDGWGQLALTFAEQWLLPIETAIGYLVALPFGPFSIAGNVILGQNGHELMIAEACSAFRNTIVTTFIWLSLVKIQGLDFRPWHFRALAMGIAVVVLLNSVRIALMAHSYDSYVFWHTGGGLIIIKSAMWVIVLGLFYLGLRRAESETV